MTIFTIMFFVSRVIIYMYITEVTGPKNALHRWWGCCSFFKRLKIKLKIPIDRFQSCDQQLCKLLGIKESFNRWKEFNSHRIFFEHKYGCRSIVLYTNMASMMSWENNLLADQSPTSILMLQMVIQAITSWWFWLSIWFN